MSWWFIDLSKYDPQSLEEFVIHAQREFWAWAGKEAIEMQVNKEWLGEIDGTFIKGVSVIPGPIAYKYTVMVR